MSRTLRFALFSLLTIAAAPSAARAQDACAAERQRLCGGAVGPGAKMSCMKAHEAELSEPCKAQRAVVKQAAHEVHADCHPDVARLCQGVAPGGGRLRDCLKAHEAELSPSCRQAVTSLEDCAEAIHPGCQADRQRLCQGVAPGGGRIVACLQSHQAELSAGCRTRLEQRMNRRAPAPPPAPPAR